MRYGPRKPSIKKSVKARTTGKAKSMFMKLKIREVRKRRNLTQIELAKLTGISKSSISRYEREDLWPDMLEMEWIALAMDVKITDLFDSEVK